MAEFTVGQRLQMIDNLKPHIPVHRVHESLPGGVVLPCGRNGRRRLAAEGWDQFIDSTQSTERRAIYRYSLPRVVTRRKQSSCIYIQ
jgi:hypothetical protein